MAVVLEYTNQSGYRNERVWKPGDEKQFTALVKCYVESPKGKQQVIEKPSTRPATFEECCKMARKLKNEYGHNLKQLLIWNMDEMETAYPNWM